MTFGAICPTYMRLLTNKYTAMKTVEILENALKNGFANTYSGDTRTWMDHVDEDAIYQSLTDPDFASFVHDIVEDSMSDKLRPAA